MSRTIDPNHGQQHDPILGQQAHPYPRTLEKPAPSTPTTATRRPPVDHEPTTTHQAPTLWRSTHRRSRTGNAKARGADRPRDHPHLDQQTRPRHRTHEKPNPSTPKTTTNRPAQRPKPRPTNEPQRRTHEKPAPPTPATATRTTHTTASNHAHNLEHQRSTRHRQRSRPPAGNTSTTPQPAPRLWRRTLRRSRTGDARQGTRTGHVTTQPSTSRHAHNLEHQRSPRHQHRRRPPGRPTPRPAITPTTSNTLVTHTLDHPRVNDLDHGQPPHNQPRNCGVEHSGEAGRVTPGRGRGTGRGSAPKDVDMTTTWGMYADTSPNSTTSTDVPTRPRKYAHHHPQPV